jgi:glycosyltransferase involved in cell wall biosynthesis
MGMMPISIAMCTYNGEKYLRTQLDSIARQSRLPDELVICDDNSSDSTVQVINAFATSVSFPVRLCINDANIGSTRNFEQAIRLCAGEIIVLSDQDDVWHQGKLKLIAQVFHDSGETGALFSNGNVVNDSLLPMGYTLWDACGFQNRQQAQFKAGKALEVLLKQNVITGATLAFRSALRDLFFPIPVEWVHDGWIAILAVIFSNVDFIDNCLIDYRQHSNQQIGSMKRSFRENQKNAASVNNYHHQIKAAELLVEHIKQHKMTYDSPVVTTITDKIAHLKARNSICRGNRFTGLIQTGIELVSGRYHKYSNGYLSACKDLLKVAT